MYNNKFENAGELISELKEAEKLIIREETDKGRTHTDGCGSFLTLICC